MSSSTCPTRERFCSEHAQRTSLLHRSERPQRGQNTCTSREASAWALPAVRPAVSNGCASTWRQVLDSAGPAPTRTRRRSFSLWVLWKVNNLPLSRHTHRNGSHSGLKMNKCNKMFESSSTSVSPFHGVSILSSRCKSKAHTRERIRMHKRNTVATTAKAHAPFAFAPRAVLQLMLHR